MAWEVEYTDELGAWWDTLDGEEQESVAVYVRLLEERGPDLPFPYSSGVEQLPAYAYARVAGTAPGDALSSTLRL